MSKTNKIFSNFLKSDFFHAMESAKEVRNFSLRKGRKEFYDKNIKPYTNSLMEEWLDEFFGCCYNADDSKGKSNTCSSNQHNNTGNHTELFEALHTDEWASFATTNDFIEH